MLLHAREVGEADVEELDVRLLDELEDFGRITEHVTVLQGKVGDEDAVVRPVATLSGRGFPAMTPMFRACYTVADR
ncbi:hypothetical protein GCM10017608_15740 [Agromyces luteolus]|nr:hypothetical protein GCM10017608_15740 [Agromyces luteolus]